MDASKYADELHPVLRDRVDHIDAAVGRLDGDIEASAVFADRDVVRMAGQRNLLRDPQGLRIDDVERRGDSLLRYSRLPSGAAAAPWMTSASGISATIVSLTGSIRCTLSPAEFV